jgi:hypothetical protein
MPLMNNAATYTRMATFWFTPRRAPDLAGRMRLD